MPSSTARGFEFGIQAATLAGDRAKATRCAAFRIGNTHNDNSLVTLRYQTPRSPARIKNLLREQVTL